MQKAANNATGVGGGFAVMIDDGRPVRLSPDWVILLPVEEAGRQMACKSTDSFRRVRILGRLLVRSVILRAAKNSTPASKDPGHQAHQSRQPDHLL